MRWWTSLLALLLTITPVVEATHASPGDRCTDFRSKGRLRRGQSFRAEIGGGLEFRLTAHRGGSVWIISVGPRGTTRDYLWLVSPPLQTAPHLMIGEAYGITAWQSARLTPRTFRFVLTSAEYDRARKLVDEGTTDTQSSITAADLERMGRGTLTLRITGFAQATGADALEWITFNGRACMPRA